MEPWGRTPRTGHCKYSLNEDFWKTWTEASAYIAGFAWADGHLTKRGTRLGLYQKDGNHLQRLARLMGSDAVLHAAGAKGSGMWALYIPCRNFCRDLSDLGFPNGARASKPLMPVPDEVFHHFVRGWSDGDGHFHKLKPKTPRHAVWEMYGDKGQLADLQQRLESTMVLSRGNLRNSHGTVWALTYCGESARLIRDWMYAGATVLLERKRDVAFGCQVELTPIQGCVLRPLKVMHDERGFLFEVLRHSSRLSSKIAQTYIAACRPNIAKAFHLHTKQQDAFCIVHGTAKIGLADLRGPAREDYRDEAWSDQFFPATSWMKRFGMRKPTPSYGKTHSLVMCGMPPSLLIIPAGVAHGQMALGSELSLLLNSPDVEYNRDMPDELRIPFDAFSFTWPPRSA